MKLTYYNALGTVDDECSSLCHERNGAEINLLLLDVPNILNPGFPICLIYDQSNRNANRDLEGHPLVKTLVFIIFDLSEAVRNKLQRSCACKVTNGKDALESTLKAYILSLFGQNILLQKAGVGVLLHFDQIRKRNEPWNLTKTPSYPLACQ